MLEAESGINDAPAVLLVLLLSTTGRRRAAPWWQQALLVGYELAAGAAIGLVVGRRRRAGRCAGPRCPSAGPLPAGRRRADRAGVRRRRAWRTPPGFLAVYVAGVVLGNARLPHRHAILGFADGLAWLAQIGLFVLLGLLVVAGRAGRRAPAGAAGRARRWCCWPGRCRWRCRVPPFRRRLARPGLPVLGRAARRGADRAGHDPALGSACRARERSSTSSSSWWWCSPLAQGSTLAAGRRLARRDRAGRGHRAAGRDRAAGTDAGRPAAVGDPRRFPAGRRPHRRAAAAGRRRRSRWCCATAPASCPAPTPGCGPATAC